MANNNTPSTPLDNFNKILSKTNPERRMWVNRSFVFGEYYNKDNDFRNKVIEFYSNEKNANMLFEKIAKFDDLQYTKDDFDIFENMFDVYKNATSQTTEEVQQQLINQFKNWKVSPEEIQKHFRIIKESAEEVGWQGNYDHLNYNFESNTAQNNVVKAQNKRKKTKEELEQKDIERQQRQIDREYRIKEDTVEKYREELKRVQGEHQDLYLRMEYGEKTPEILKRSEILEQEADSLIKRINKMTNNFTSDELDLIHEDKNKVLQPLLNSPREGAPMFEGLAVPSEFVDKNGNIKPEYTSQQNTEKTIKQKTLRSKESIKNKSPMNVSIGENNYHLSYNNEINPISFTGSIDKNTGQLNYFDVDVNGDAITQTYDFTNKMERDDFFQTLDGNIEIPEILRKLNDNLNSSYPAAKNVIENTTTNTIENITETTIENTVETVAETVIKDTAENVIENTVETVIENTVETVAENVLEEGAEKIIKETTGLNVEVNKPKNKSKKKKKKKTKNQKHKAKQKKAKKVIEQNKKNTYKPLSVEESSKLYQQQLDKQISDVNNIIDSTLDDITYGYTTGISMDNLPGKENEYALNKSGRVPGVYDTVFPDAPEGYYVDDIVGIDKADNNRLIKGEELVELPEGVHGPLEKKKTRRLVGGPDTDSMATKAIKGLKDLSVMELGMSAFNVLGAVGDYKDARRKGHGVVSSAVRAGAKFALDEAMGFYALPFYLIKDVPKYAIQGADMLYKENRRMNSAANNQAFGTAQFADTQQLATMRQSSLEMAKMSSYNLQQTIMGREAEFMHR